MSDCHIRLWALCAAAIPVPDGYLHLSLSLSRPRKLELYGRAFQVPLLTEQSTKEAEEEEAAEKGVDNSFGSSRPRAGEIGFTMANARPCCLLMLIINIKSFYCPSSFLSSTFAFDI